MAYLPTLNRKRSQQLVTTSFAGINRAERVNDGEFAEMLNMSTREYPLLCPRKPRGTAAVLESPAGLAAKEQLCWVDGTKVYYAGSEVIGLTVSDAAADNPKQLVGMGAYVVIFPDKKYFNTIDFTEYGSLEGGYASQGDVTYTMCRLDGEDYGTVTASASAPESPDNGDYWIDTSGDEHKLMCYSEVYGTWQHILTVYTRISCAGIDRVFAMGDTITIAGAEADAGADAALAAQIAALNGSHYVYGTGEDYITVLGLLDAAYIQTAGQLTANRYVPDMEYVIESENRLWGCHYGRDADGNTLNEIYACKLGDFKNWRVYQGIATDSYTVSIGSDGPFTGAITYGGYPMFFKENCVHKIYGSRPANYQVMTTQMRGVQAGSSRSLCIVDDMLMYLSGTGVEAYEGSLPVCVSEALGERTRTGGVAGSVGGRYYLSCTEDGEARTYVYDTKRNVWTEEDAVEAICYVPHANDLYALTESGSVLTMLGSAGTPEAEVKWQCVTGLMGWEDVRQKYVTRWNIRMAVKEGAGAEASVQYDGHGRWQKKAQTINEGQRTRTLLMPVYPRRCDHMRLRISGHGDVRIYSMARIMSSGGDGQWGR